jgi:hypothetical protein
MKYHICDMCGARIGADELRYELKLSVVAAYDTLKIELADLATDCRDEIRKLVEEMKHMDPRQLEEDVFKELNFDLCRSCQQGFIKDPLGKDRGRSAAPTSLPAFDVEEFLRRLKDE